MTLKHYLSIGGSAFVGGISTWLATHATGVPTTAQAAEALAAGAVIAGLIAVLHLFQPAPGTASPSAPVAK